MGGYMAIHIPKQKVKRKQNEENKYNIQSDVKKRKIRR